MIEDSKMLKDIKSLPRKLQLLFIISLKQIESVGKNSSAKGIPFELEEINKIQKINRPDFLIFLYINKDRLHDQLYENEEFLKIDIEIKDKKISQYIYLCLLIEDRAEVCNYQYLFELISKLNDIQRGEKEKILKKIIMAKMILSLVDNYRQIDNNEDNKGEEELDKISNFNKNILTDNDNITKLNQYKLKIEDINLKKIEEIYLIIIKYLIENSKLEDFEFIENIINQIELESIFLTKLMLNELNIILTKEKEYIKKYEIISFDDIFDKSKIYFYYNLIKYILKQSLYIFQFQFLLETSKKILDLIKNNLGKLSTFIKKSNYKYQIEYILKQFIGENFYKYYYEASESLIKINQSLNSSQQSKKYDPNSSYLNAESVQAAHDNINNEFEKSNYDSSSSGPFSKESYKSIKEKSNRSFDNDFEEEYNENELEYKILNNSKFILHTNKKGKKPFIIYDEIKIIKNGKEIENKTIEEVKNATTNNDKLSNNYIKFLSFLNKFESNISNEFNNSYKLKLTLTFETQNIKNDDFIIICLYDVEIPGENNEQFRDDNILTNGIGEGFQYVLSEINSSNYSKKEYS